LEDQQLEGEFYQPKAIAVIKQYNSVKCAFDFTFKKLVRFKHYHRQLAEQFEDESEKLMRILS